ncbi:hypothetical protein IWZ03DRAFT_418772 [Phyllosticta citriasiana]|uniref:Uncharacterized protein n=1 Tax=Phyllosticta citriasiana TaxID=595635 RepID=A0ABR1KBN4_9PEZI
MSATLTLFIVKAWRDTISRPRQELARRPTVAVGNQSRDHRILQADGPFPSAVVNEKLFQAEADSATPNKAGTAPISRKSADCASGLPPSMERRQLAELGGVSNVGTGRVLFDKTTTSLARIHHGLSNSRDPGPDDGSRLVHLNVFDTINRLHRRGADLQVQLQLQRITTIKYPDNWAKDEHDLSSNNCIIATKRQTHEALRPLQHTAADCEIRGPSKPNRAESGMKPDLGKTYQT